MTRSGLSSKAASSRPSIASIGELDGADVLIDDGTIVAIGRNLLAPDADVIDARDKLVLPGLIDTHRHTWETLTRSLISEGDLAVYQKLINGLLGLALPAAGRLHRQPARRDRRAQFRHHHDARLVAHHELAGACRCRDQGARQFRNARRVRLRLLSDRRLRRASRARSSAAPPTSGAWRSNISASTDQLVTLAIAARTPPNDITATIADIRLARELGVRTTMHVTKAGVIAALAKAQMLGPDITCVHAVGDEATDDELKALGEHGGTLSTSSATEMMSGHGFPSVQRWLRYGLRPSLSVDNETRMPSDLFAQMRALVISDHQLEADRVRREGGRPVLVPVRDVLEFATIQGARTVGLDHKVGTLSLGKRADLILVDLDDLSSFPRPILSRPWCSARSRRT